MTEVQVTDASTGETKTVVVGASGTVNYPTGSGIGASSKFRKLAEERGVNLQKEIERGQAEQIARRFGGGAGTISEQAKRLSEKTGVSKAAIERELERRKTRIVRTEVITPVKQVAPERDLKLESERRLIGPTFQQLAERPYGEAQRVSISETKESRRPTERKATGLAAIGLGIAAPFTYTYGAAAKAGRQVLSEIGGKSVDVAYQLSETKLAKSIQQKVPQAIRKQKTREESKLKLKQLESTALAVGAFAFDPFRKQKLADVAFKAVGRPLIVGQETAKTFEIGGERRLTPEERQVYKKYQKEQPTIIQNIFAGEMSPLYAGTAAKKGISKQLMESQGLSKTEADKLAKEIQGDPQKLREYFYGLGYRETPQQAIMEASLIKEKGLSGEALTTALQKYSGKPSLFLTDFGFTEGTAEFTKAIGELQAPSDDFIPLSQMTAKYSKKDAPYYKRALEENLALYRVFTGGRPQERKKAIEQEAIRLGLKGRKKDLFISGQQKLATSRIGSEAGVEVVSEFVGETTGGGLIRGLFKGGRIFKQKGALKAGLETAKGTFGGGVGEAGTSFFGTKQIKKDPYNIKKFEDTIELAKTEAIGGAVAGTFGFGIGYGTAAKKPVVRALTRILGTAADPAELTADIGEPIIRKTLGAARNVRTSSPAIITTTKGKKIKSVALTTIKEPSISNIKPATKAPVKIGNIPINLGKIQTRTTTPSNIVQPYNVPISTDTRITTPIKTQETIPNIEDLISEVPTKAETITGVPITVPSVVPDRIVGPIIPPLPLSPFGIGGGGAGFGKGKRSKFINELKVGAALLGQLGALSPQIARHQKIKRRKISKANKKKLKRFSQTFGFGFPKIL